MFARNGCFIPAPAPCARTTQARGLSGRSRIPETRRASSTAKVSSRPLISAGVATIGQTSNAPMHFLNEVGGSHGRHGEARDLPWSRSAGYSHCQGGYGLLVDWGLVPLRQDGVIVRSGPPRLTGGPPIRL